MDNLNNPMIDKIYFVRDKKIISKGRSNKLLKNLFRLYPMAGS